MDAALFRAACAASVSAHEGVTVREVQQREVFHVVTREKTFTARAVVNTTGRWSQLTRFEAARKEKWIGLKAHLREAAPPSSVDLYFFPGGYCGVTPAEGDAVNACAMVLSDTAHTLEDVFALDADLQQRSRGWRQLFPTVTTSPLYFRKPQTESLGMVLAGDSAGFIDPFAGDGISLALHSGTLAAESLAPFFAGKRSLQQVHEQYAAVYGKRFVPAFRNARRLRTALSSPAWARPALFAMARLPGVAEMLVRGTRAR
jgi:flavin-dependent dehydrogenase